MNLYVLRTHYPHWSKYSGYNRLLNFLPKNIKYIEDVVSMDSTDLINDKSIEKDFTNIIKKYSPSSYNLNDFLAEMKLHAYWSSGNDIDIVHYFDGEHGISLFPEFLKKQNNRKKPKIVVTYHQPNEILKDFLIPRILKLADKIIVLCQAQKEFISKYIPEDKIQVIYHGVDIEHYKPAKRSYNPIQPLKCISVGTWLRDYEIIIETAQLLIGRNIEFHVINPELSTDKTLQLYVHKNVSDEALTNLYHTSDLLFLPFKYSTANNVILEGMASGLPVMSNNLESVKEYTGWDNPLIFEKEAKLFANKLIELSQNRSMLKKLSQKSIKRAYALKWSCIAKQYADVYSSL